MLSCPKTAEYSFIIGINLGDVIEEGERKIGAVPIPTSLNHLSRQRLSEEVKARKLLGLLDVPAVERIRRSNIL